MKRPYGYDYSEATLAAAAQMIEAAYAEDPTKPIFVIQHAATSDTILGSMETVTKADGTTLKGDTSDSAVPTLFDLQSKYSNLIVISGHSHYPANDVASIYQKYFTAINTGVLGGAAGQSKVDGNALYFSRSLLSKKGVPENDPFAVRFMCDTPMVVSHKDHQPTFRSSIN